LGTAEIEGKLFRGILTSVTNHFNLKLGGEFPRNPGEVSRARDHTAAGVIDPLFGLFNFTGEIERQRDILVSLLGSSLLRSDFYDSTILASLVISCRSRSETVGI